MSKQNTIKGEAIDDGPSQGTPAKTLSEVLGIDPVLPGEPVADYRQGLKELMVELDAKSVLQVYLAEKIYECLWWIRRYEEQKRATVIAEMGLQVAGVARHMMSPIQSSNQQYLRETLLQNKLDKASVDIVAASGYSLDSLRQAAMDKQRDELQHLDQQIALQTKILAGLQVSYEVAFNRKRNVERLDLQNAMMRRDLGAIEGEASVEPKARQRKPS